MMELVCNIIVCVLSDGVGGVPELVCPVMELVAVL